MLVEIFLEGIFIKTVQRKHSFDLLADDIGGFTAFDVDDLGIMGDNASAIHALFRINAREVSIRCKTIIDMTLFFNVVFDASGTGLFVAAQDQTHSFLERIAFVDQILQRIHRCNGTALVIGYASSKDETIFFNHCERITGPAFTGRHDVQMRQDTDELFTFTRLTKAAVIVKIAWPQSFFFHHLQGGVEDLAVL